MSKIDDFKSCKNQSSNQIELMKSNVQTSSNLKESYIKMIKFNENCSATGQEAALEVGQLDNYEYTKQVQKSIELSQQRMSLENKMYSILLKQTDFSKSNNNEVSDQLNIILIVLNKYTRPQEIKAWAGTELVAQGKSIKDYENNISITGIFTFLIIFVIFYAYAKAKMDEKDENKNK